MDISIGDRFGKTFVLKEITTNQRGVQDNKREFRCFDESGRIVRLSLQDLISQGDHVKRRNK